MGKPGRRILKKRLSGLKGELSLDFVIVNGENAAGGSGITLECFKDLVKAGADCVTTGDHVWRKKEIVQVMETDDRVLRPANYPSASPGKGFAVYKSRGGALVAVCSLIGRIFMDPAECPFAAADRVLDEIGESAKTVIFDVHAEATSEKVALGRYLDGHASAVVGTHTHVATADETILPGGTAYITDVGMTGPHDGVIGRRTDRVLRKFISGYPSSFEIARGDVRINGVLLDIDEKTGTAESIERICVKDDL